MTFCILSSSCVRVIYDSVCSLYCQFIVKAILAIAILLWEQKFFLLWYASMLLNDNYQHIKSDLIMFMYYVHRMLIDAASIYICELKVCI